MHIGIAGPISLSPVKGLFPEGAVLPPTFSFPLIGVLARELHRRGHKISIFATSREITTPTSISAERIQVFVHPLRTRHAAYDWFRAERTYLTTSMKDARCDIIHAHWCYEFAASAIASGTPHLVTAHDSPAAIFLQFLGTRFAPYWTMRALFGASVIRRARAMTTVSPYCREHIRKTLFPRAEIEVIPNGIEPAIWDLGESRLKTGAPDGPPVIASVMDGFSKRKNATTALEAFAIFRQSHPEARYKIFGTSFGQNEEAHQWARAHRLDSGVEFHGRTPQEVMFPALLKECHIFLHPSREESFGMAPLEAMALGIPTVGGANSGGVPYVLGYGEDGLLVDIQNAQAISGKLDELWRDPDLRDTLAKKGRKRANDAFSLNAMVDSYEAAYTRILRAN